MLFFCFFCERDLKFIHYNNFRVESKVHVVVLTLSRDNRKTGRDIKIGKKTNIKYESCVHSLRPYRHIHMS